MRDWLGRGRWGLWRGSVLNGLNERQDCCRCWVLEAVALVEGREVVDIVQF